MWEFNEEAVARAVAASRIPVVSAVGHEIDFTICDFAADLRAPTPSAAAEMVTPREEDLLDRLEGCARHLRSAVELRVASAARRVEALAGAPLFREPVHLLEMRSQQLDELQMRFVNRLERCMTEADHRLNALELRLQGMDPKRQLERGYAILANGTDGKPLTSAKNVASGTAVKAILADGELALHVD